LCTGGAKFGYSLLFVIFLSNACAVVLQHLALKLGVATNRDLAQTCRDQLHPYVNFILWVLCEIAIGACDLAEVIGSAIAINLLFGLPLPAGCIITAADVLLILLLEQSHIRYLEIAVAALMLIIAGCFVAVISMTSPLWSDVFMGFLPHTELVNNSTQLLVGLSILGATVMPHNLYLHSHLVMTRAFPRTVEGKNTAIQYATLDSTLSLAFAFVVNCMILILAASVFHNTEHSNVADLDDAYRLLTPALGKSASIVFALALLASGQNSTITGTLAGQIVFEGFLEIQVAPWLRRLLTRGLAIIPATIVASVMGAEAVNQMLIFSQLILSLQLGFAVIPLIYFTSNEELMTKDHVNSKRLTIVGVLMSLGIVALNIFLVVETLNGNTP
jgi:manganese transport protein